MNKALFYFKITMAVVYTAIGVYILVNPTILSGIIETTYAAVIGVLILAYGLFRGYNTLKAGRNND